VVRVAILLDHRVDLPVRLPVQKYGVEIERVSSHQHSQPPHGFARIYDECLCRNFENGFIEQRIILAEATPVATFDIKPAKACGPSATEQFVHFLPKRALPDIQGATCALLLATARSPVEWGLSIALKFADLS
jgi:hypothetical protein